MMKLTVLAENLTYKMGLLAEHGLSMHIEANGMNILFDTGQSDAFIRNADRLNIDISEVDLVVISHGHYDHIGGLNDFLRVNRRAKVFVKRNAFDEKYHGNLRYIGSAVDAGLAERRLVFIDSLTEITDNLFVVVDVPILNPEDMNIRDFTVKNANRFEQDWFDDELFMVLDTPEGAVVISSCSHRGISNILSAARSQVNPRVKSVVGGLHLNNGPQPAIDRVIDTLREADLESIHVNHCTGVTTYAQLLHHLGGRVSYLSTGMHLCL